MSKKKQFIESILTMNTKPLEDILVKNAFTGYSNTPFLEELTQTFIKLKADGDTHLNLYRGKGVCTCNEGEKVFCFVGNKSNNYFLLPYRESKDNYFDFFTSCDNVQYDEVFELNKFYYFSIHIKKTIEYHNLVSAHKPMSQYRDFSTKDTCKMATIELWLKNHKNIYNETVTVTSKVDELSIIIQKDIELLIKKEFEILYKKLSFVSKLHKKEIYFKKQLINYEKIKDSISNREKWFDYQEENQNEYELFSRMFYDNREQTYYRLKVKKLIIDRSDFKYTLKFMDILEDNQREEVIGKIKIIEDLKVFENPKKGRPYSERKIIISVGERGCDEYQIVFRDGRTKNLENIVVGQHVKILVDFIGFKKDNQYKVNLWGWKIEQIELKKKIIKKHNNEMELYDKAFFIEGGLPF